MKKPNKIVTLKTLSYKYCIVFCGVLLGLVLLSAQALFAQKMYKDKDGIVILKMISDKQLADKPIAPCLSALMYYPASFNEEAIKNSTQLADRDKVYLNKQLKRNKCRCKKIDNSWLEGARPLAIESDSIFFSLTLPIFNSQRDICIVGISNFCKIDGMSCSNGKVLAYKKENDKWSLLELLFVWMDN